MSSCLLCRSLDRQKSIALPTYDGFLCHLCAICGTCGQLIPDELAMHVNWDTGICWHAAKCSQWCLICEDWRSRLDFATCLHNVCLRHCERCGADFENNRGGLVVPDRAQHIRHLQQDCPRPRVEMKNA